MWFNYSFHIFRPLFFSPKSAVTMFWMFTAENITLFSAHLRYFNRYSILCQGKEYGNLTLSVLSEFWEMHQYSLILWGGMRSQQGDIGCLEKKLFISSPQRAAEWIEKSVSANHETLLLTRVQDGPSQTFCSCSCLHHLAQTYLQLRKTSPLVDIQKTKYCYSSCSGFKNLNLKNELKEKYTKI